MTCRVTHRTADGGSSMIEITAPDGTLLLRAQRDGDLMRCWPVGNNDVFLLGRWLAEAERHLPEGDRRMISEAWEHAKAEAPLESPPGDW